MPRPSRRQQLGLFTDAEAMTPITRFEGDTAPLAYLDYTTASTALPPPVQPRSSHPRRGRRLAHSARPLPRCGPGGRGRTEPSGHRARRRHVRRLLGQDLLSTAGAAPMSRRPAASSPGRDASTISSNCQRRAPSARRQAAPMDLVRATSTRWRRSRATCGGSGLAACSQQPGGCRCRRVTRSSCSRPPWWPWSRRV